MRWLPLRWLSLAVLGVERERERERERDPGDLLRGVTCCGRKEKRSCAEGDKKTWLVSWVAGVDSVLELSSNLE